MGKTKDVFKSFRVIILIIVILLSIVAIHPNLGKEGVSIKTIVKDSASEISGLKSPKTSISPTSLEVITTVNNYPITSPADYYKITSNLNINQTITIKTNKGVYSLKVQPKITRITNNQTNATTEYIDGAEDLGIKIDEIATTNLRKGLDLSGGTRVLLKPEEKLSDDNLTLLIDRMKQRLNVYGLSDINIRKISDTLGGGEDTYILVEIAGVNEEEVKNLVSKEGKFEAKIGEQTVFSGGKDITYVCRTAECSGIDPRVGCGPIQGGYVCRFRFSIRLDTEAAKRQAEISDTLSVIEDQGQSYLNETLDLYLDNSKVDSLNIGADLKGNAVQEIEISGSGVGVTEQEAMQTAINNMKELQTVLVTGSLPVKIEIIKTDSLSPTLGKEFTKNAILIALLSMLAVSLIILVKYKNPVISVAVIITMAAEIIILLGFSALLGSSIDIAAIAGIIVAIGTGVDDQIVITDEALGKRRNQDMLNWTQKIKNAFFIIMAAYFTVVVSMIPLIFAGAGMLKGFALTTIIGVTIGVLVTRPAYAAFIKIMLNK